MASIESKLVETVFHFILYIGEKKGWFFFDLVILKWSVTHLIINNTPPNKITPFVMTCPRNKNVVVGRNCLPSTTVPGTERGRPRTSRPTLLLPIREYISRRQNTAIEYITTRPNLRNCSGGTAPLRLIITAQAMVASSRHRRRRLASWYLVC